MIRLLPVGVLASGEGTNLQALIDAFEAGKIPGAAIRVVISDRREALALQRARRHNIPAVFLDPKPFQGDREAYDKKITRCFMEYGVSPKSGLILLAGYMRILSPYFVKRYRWRILNIHPALLPAFPGLEAQRQALEHGVKVTGCTVHFVDEGVDTGPIILQAAVPVQEDETVETLTERIKRVEHRLYPEAVNLFAEGKLRVQGRRVSVLP